MSATVVTQPESQVPGLIATPYLASATKMFSLASGRVVVRRVRLERAEGAERLEEIDAKSPYSTSWRSEEGAVLLRGVGNVF